MNERQEFASLEAALREFPWWEETNVEVIQKRMAGLKFARIYTPPGRSYIGLVPDSGGAIVSLHYGYIAGLRDQDGRNWIALPINRIRDGGNTQGGTPETDPCPECGILLPRSGLCGTCYC